jgi:hypothetical protein
MLPPDCKSLFLASQHYTVSDELVKDKQAT